MARDLFLGRTRRNWARESCSSSPSGRRPSPPITDEVSLRLTEPEIAMLAELAATKSRAEAGDRPSRKKMQKLNKRVASLKKKAVRGDASAKRTLLVLNESGVFRPTQTITMGGPLCVSGAQISNKDYRVAVLKQARRVAGNQTPTTIHFFKAKSAVDGTMRKAGLSLFLPGSRRGRVTN
jgi:hypothetical protein